MTNAINLVSQADCRPQHDHKATNTLPAASFLPQPLTGTLSQPLTPHESPLTPPFGRPSPSLLRVLQFQHKFWVSVTLGSSLLDIFVADGFDAFPSTFLIRFGACDSGHYNLNSGKYTNVSHVFLFIFLVICRSYLFLLLPEFLFFYDSSSFAVNSLTHTTPSNHHFLLLAPLTPRLNIVPVSTTTTVTTTIPIRGPPLSSTDLLYVLRENKSNTQQTEERLLKAEGK